MTEDPPFAVPYILPIEGTNLTCEVLFDPDTGKLFSINIDGNSTDWGKLLVEVPHPSKRGEKSFQSVELFMTRLAIDTYNKDKDAQAYIEEAKRKKLK